MPLIRLLLKNIRQVQVIQIEKNYLYLVAYC